MASAIDATSYQPTTLTTSFKTYSDIYATFQISYDNTDVTQQNPGYVLAKYYIRNAVVSTSDPLKFDDSTGTHGYFSTQYYRSTTDGAVELYWCRQADCSDCKLAQTTNFTVVS